MSTMPGNPTDAADALAQAALLPTAAPDVDEIVRRFQTAARDFRIEAPAPTELLSLCAQVATFTRELFPGEMRMRVKNDPEIPDDLFFQLHVEATGDIDDIAARHDQWHARLCRFPSKFCGLFRLSIAVR